MKVVVDVYYMDPIKLPSWKLIEIASKNFNAIFKNSSAKHLDYQEANVLQESQERKVTAYLFPLKYYGRE